MEKTVSAAYANQNFAALLKEAEEGQTIVVTRYNKSVAKIAPMKPKLRRQPVLGSGEGKKIVLDESWADPMSAEDFVDGKF